MHTVSVKCIKYFKKVNCKEEGFLEVVTFEILELGSKIVHLNFHLSYLQKKYFCDLVFLVKLDTTT